MSLYSMWVHGNTARTQWVGDPPIMQAQDRRADGSIGGVPWTDIVGLPQGPQMIFRGRGHTGGLGGARTVPQPSTYFHFMIPTPVIIKGQRAKLLRVFVLWTADPSIALQEVYAFDGPRSLPVSFSTPVGGGRSGAGVSLIWSRGSQTLMCRRILKSCLASGFRLVSDLARMAMSFSLLLVQTSMAQHKAGYSKLPFITGPTLTPEMKEVSDEIAQLRYQVHAES